MNRTLLIVALACLVSIASASRAELKLLEICEREPFAGGMAFGEVGPYERIVGVARFEIDPEHVRNQSIVDLKLAPCNAAGKVEFESDVYILAPKDPAKGNGAILYDVNNRGGKLALRFFNHTTANNAPTTAEHAGDGFLMRQGYTIVWSGWLGELQPGEGRLLMRAPVALQDGKPLKGPVRYEIMTDVAAETMPLSRREKHGSFPLTERGLKEATLTHRWLPDDERIPIPREAWSLETMPIPKVEHGVAGTLPQIRMRLAGGFKPGRLYELVAECEGSLVQGVCYPAVRDLVSFFRYDDSERNPLRGPSGKPAIDRAHAFGVSQSGRYLRNFIYLGFNADERDRIVFNGIIPHVAGAGLGWFNHRFCQPTRLNSQHLEHTYPSDYFPFAYGTERDPITQRSDGILLRATADPATMPKIMHTQGSGEYWSRAGSLVHTDPLGHHDVAIPDNVRIYTFGGTQHSATSLPLTRGFGKNFLNPADYNPQLRALLKALDRWTRDEKALPPASVYPRIADGRLVRFADAILRFPVIPGQVLPEVIHQPARLDFGPEFESKGISTIEPPQIGARYGVRVPNIGPDGNELGTLLPVEVAVPIATYTGWNLRANGGGRTLVSLMGSYIPFAMTYDERRGDQRESLAERYNSFAAYRMKFEEVCADYVRRGYLLEEDVERLLQSIEPLRAKFPAPKSSSLEAGPSMESVSSPRIVATSELASPEAHQAAAADEKFVYAIANKAVAKYDRATGERIAVSKPAEFAKHLNSGFFRDGKLYCAHSNFPAQPSTSEIIVLDPSKMTLEVYKSFGTYRGSLTWAVYHEKHWWCTFAHYGATNSKTVLVKLDDDWNERGAWTYPTDVVADLGGASISGGLWLDGQILATGHDKRVIYRLKLPAEGRVLELIDVVATPFPGQGIAADPKTGGLVGIDRAKKMIVFAELQK